MNWGRLADLVCLGALVLFCAGGPLAIFILGTNPR